MEKPRVKKPRILVIVGPTASGKSDLAVRLARTYNGEVISADSRQVYRGLDIGSGKITKKEMRDIPHHLLDVADPKKTYTASDFAKDAQKSIGEIISRKKLPILCGGTGFYIDAALGKKLPQVPPHKRLRNQLEKKTAEQLFSLLQKIDPRRAKSIDGKNRVRLVRAIEIATALGKVPTLAQKNIYDAVWIGIDVPRDELKKKIEKRLRKRMQGGMVAEVRKLNKIGLSWKRLEELGLEYRWTARYVRKQVSKKEFEAGLAHDILNYAKRQMTWFKGNKDIHWVNPPAKLKIIEKMIKSSLLS